MTAPEFKEITPPPEQLDVGQIWFDARGRYLSFSGGLLLLMGRDRDTWSMANFMLVGGDGLLAGATFTLGSEKEIRATTYLGTIADHFPALARLAAEIAKVQAEGMPT